MKLKLHNGSQDDWIIVTGDTIEEIRQKGYKEMKKRGWKGEDCWSEKVGAESKDET